MDKYHLHWFTDEIHMHASSAVASYMQLLRLLADPETRQTRNVWFVLLSFLTHAAMVSKFLDPIRPDDAKEERGKALREHLEVADRSAFLPRDARDNLEHIDERIDRWVQRGDIKVLEMVFEDRAGFDFIAERNGAIRRVLIWDEMVFISEDRNGNRIETALSPIFEALQTLHARCEHKLRTESPYSYLLAQALRNYPR
jgi:hypothetical protein